MKPHGTFQCVCVCADDWWCCFEEVKMDVVPLRSIPEGIKSAIVGPNPLCRAFHCVCVCVCGGSLEYLPVIFCCYVSQVCASERAAKSFSRLPAVHVCIESVSIQPPRRQTPAGPMTDEEAASFSPSSSPSFVHSGYSVHLFITRFYIQGFSILMTYPFVSLSLWMEGNVRRWKWPSELMLCGGPIVPWAGGSERKGKRDWEREKQSERAKVTRWTGTLDKTGQLTLLLLNETCVRVCMVDHKSRLQTGQRKDGSIELARKRDAR